ncbi:aminotransferase class III-fold pyridoxal phosphate-dependent enzyme [uncultured Roseivirga sp.]|uniref:aminotransferase class III-fold pyridoxal phosphate-dependent enzyme n=1 Tax=uncultured Roseivirga sp. TaxID=543088 RepID=UPI0030DD196D|tara:strand:+ start:5122 stop:6450 length:1329 start_codon:yes stop_codon:yes gene_type:complete
MIKAESIKTGQELYKRAKTLIPGGTMLLSKRPEMFLPEQWPAYFSKSSGCQVWGIDGTHYLDMCSMGIGTNSLGYGNSRIDAEVRRVIDQGNMSSLNCPEEVYLAEKLVELHPWADMVRFARSGGEANAIAIRIARAASGRDKVAICGYHGWHDWYLSANLSEDEGLDGHLMPGLDPAGVPRHLKGSVIPFNYNDLGEITEIVKNNPDLGVIKMEVSRNFGPATGYLEGIRKLATDNNIVLIFDECSSGFRQTYGGLHKMYGVEPDMCMFGKALGNGYAITAVVGKRSVMEAAQKTFISSTFWTERIGPTAGLECLKVMGEIKSWDIITNIGLRVTKEWKAMGERCGLKLNTMGIPALTFFSIDSPDWLKYKTFITQEMLKKGILAFSGFYASVAHEDQYLARYFNELEEILDIVAQCERGEKKIENLLEGPVCHGGFKRLN